MNDCFFFYLDRFHGLEEEKRSVFEQSILPEFLLGVVFDYCPTSELLCSKSINVFFGISPPSSNVCQKLSNKSNKPLRIRLSTSWFSASNFNESFEGLLTRRYGVLNSNAGWWSISHDDDGRVIDFLCANIEAFPFKRAKTKYELQIADYQFSDVLTSDTQIPAVQQCAFSMYEELEKTIVDQLYEGGKKPTWMFRVLNLFQDPLNEYFMDIDNGGMVQGLKEHRVGKFTRKRKFSLLKKKRLKKINRGRTKIKQRRARNYKKYTSRVHKKNLKICK